MKSRTLVSQVVNFEQDNALQAVNDAVDDADPDIPPEADGPFVREIDMSTFTILTAIIF